MGSDNVRLTISYNQVRSNVGSTFERPKTIQIMAPPSLSMVGLSPNLKEAIFTVGLKKSMTKALFNNVIMIH